MGAPPFRWLGVGLFDDEEEDDEADGSWGFVADGIFVTTGSLKCIVVELLDDTCMIPPLAERLGRRAVSTLAGVLPRRSNDPKRSCT